MRLPEAPATDEAAPAASGSGHGSPFDSTASVSGSRWPTSGTSGTGATGGTDAVSGYAVTGTGTGSTAEPAEPETADEEHNAEAAPQPAEESGAAWASAGSSSGWNWGSQSSGGGTDQDQAAEAETETESAATSESAEPATAEMDEAAAPTASADVETAVEVADTGPTETGIIEETIYQTPESAFVSTAPAETPTEEPAEEPAPVAVVSDDEETGTVETAGSMATAPSSGTSAELDRANQLLDELRSLLPQLASTGQMSAGSDIVGTLRSATASEEQRASFEDLRSAVNAAQQRPRDIDTMLDISNRLDMIAALEDAYQKLSSTVEAVVSQLSDEE
jgi:hypothetical protein